MQHFRNLFFVCAFCLSISQTANAMHPEMESRCLSSLQEKVTSLLKHSSPEVQGEFKPFFEQNGESLHLSTPLSYGGFPVLKAIVVSSAPLKSLSVIHPTMKCVRIAFEEFLGTLKTHPTLETIEIIGGITDHGAQFLSSCLQENQILRSISLKNHKITPSGLAHLAKAMQNNRTLCEFNFSPSFLPNDTWILRLNKTLEQNNQLLNKYCQDLQLVRQNFSNLVREKSSSLSSERELSDAFSKVQKSFQEGLLVETLPRTDEACLKLSPAQQKAMSTFDSTLIARYILTVKDLFAKGRANDIKLAKISAGSPSLCSFAFDQDLHDIVETSSDDTIWTNLNSFFCRYSRANFSAPLYYVQKWKKRHETDFQRLDVQHNELSSAFLNQLRSFVEANEEELLSMKTLRTLSLMTEQTQEFVKEFEQEKAHILSPKQTIVEDLLNLKRTSFQQQLKSFFLKNFLTCEAIAFGTFSRHFSHNPFLSYLRYLENDLPSARLFSNHLKLHNDLETRKRALGLSALHHHSFDEMLGLSEALSTGILYRYQNQIPYFREEKSGVHKLAAVIAEQVMDYALESQEPLSIEDLVIFGTLHYPTWLKEEDTKEQLNLLRRGWKSMTLCSSFSKINSFTFWMGKTEPWDEQKNDALLFKRNIPQLLRLSGIQTETGRKFKPAQKDHQKFIQGCKVSNDDAYRLGTEAEVHHLTTLGIPFEEGTPQNSSSTASTTKKDEESDLTKRSKAYFSKVSLTIEDILDDLKQ